VIVDDTNLAKKHEIIIREIVKEYNQINQADVQVKTKFFEIELEEAIKRDLKRLNSVGERVIKQMYYQFLATKELKKLEQDEGLPQAVIVDIDGTIADNRARNPFHYDKVLEDTPIQATVEIVRLLHRSGYKIIFVSGREEICKKDTLEWLKLQQIPLDELFMRPAGDFRKDSVIKKEIFLNLIKDKYYVKFVIDDRKQVKQMWVNDLGLFVFDVNQIDLDF
jgi:predicted secreted acid phosphatase